MAKTSEGYCADSRASLGQTKGNTRTFEGQKRPARTYGSRWQKRLAKGSHRGKVQFYPNMNSVHVMCVKWCMQCPLAVHTLNTTNNKTALFINWLINCWCNHIPRTFRCEAGWISYCLYLLQCIMYWVETRLKWWGGNYTTDHNTLYFNARNFLIRRE